MLEGGALEALPLGDIGLVGICAVLTLTWLRMIMSGKFVPQAQVEQLRAGDQARIQFLEAERTADSATMASLVKQNEKLSMQGELAIALLRALQSPNATGTTANSGSGYVAPTQD